MSMTLPPDFEAYVNMRVASGAYRSPQEVLDSAFDLFKRREELLAHIDEGTRQLRSGEFTEYGPDDFEQFRADIIRLKPDNQNG
jgi:Arc/MetJ-type ribon-helix-helix transcriptional regulator